MKFSLSNLFTGILVACAVIVTGLVLIQFFRSEGNIRIHTNIIDREIDNWHEINTTAYQKGKSEAPIKIIKFFDYSCPYCKEVDPIITKLVGYYSNQVSIVYNHFPLDEYSSTFRAAVASECAADQEKFIDYHELLFANQDILDNLSFESLAAKVKIKDLSLFKKCLESEETKNIVRESVKIAHMLEIGGVPTFLINDKVVPGVRSLSEFSNVIEEILDKDYN